MKPFFWWMKLAIFLIYFHRFVFRALQTFFPFSEILCERRVCDEAGSGRSTHFPRVRVLEGKGGSYSWGWFICGLMNIQQKIYLHYDWKSTKVESEFLARGTVGRSSIRSTGCAVYIIYNVLSFLYNNRIKRGLPSRFGVAVLVSNPLFLSREIRRRYPSTLHLCIFFPTHYLNLPESRNKSSL